MDENRRLAAPGLCPGTPHSASTPDAEDIPAGSRGLGAGGAVYTQPATVNYPIANPGLLCSSARTRPPTAQGNFVSN